MRETHRRIAEYKRILPGLKEKVVAVALLLAMSTAMVTTVSFAWFAISRNPAVSGVNTTIAANGNLEIALVPFDGSIPRESLVGDSTLPTTERNLTWGNLVNLSDSAYGLDNLVLRPAMLNSYSLDKNPLYGPIYDKDGRVIDLNTDFGYSAWNSDMLRFDYTTGFGVRAISSMTEGESSASRVYNEGLNKVNALNMNVQNEYEALANRDSEINALSSIIANYMAYSLIKRGSPAASMLDTPTVTAENLGHLANMYEYAAGVMENQADTFAAFLNFEKTLSENNDEWADISYVASGEGLLSRTDANATSKTVYNDLKSKGYVYTSNGFIQEIDQFILDYQTIKNDVSALRTYQQQAQAAGGSLNWNDNLTALIGNLVDMDKCEIVDINGKSYKVKEIDGSTALGLVNQTVNAYITNGILLRFENRSGARLYAENVKFSLGTSMGTQKIYGNIMTSAYGTNVNYFETERANIAAIIEEEFGAPDRIANDTYGLAMDMWVRTNAPGTYLTLQGNVLTETKIERAMGKDSNGNVVELWTITVAIEGEEGTTVGGIEIQQTQDHDIYQRTEKDESGNDVTNWYYASNHGRVADNLVYELDENGNRGALLAKEKWEEVEYVIGYEGDNRVWNGSAYTDLTVNSSTQGSGSCYVFYADPADQLRTLTLLQAMKVAFVDENGTLLATAFLDTERHYAESGKVIVPLVLDPATSKSAGTDLNGDVIYGITALEQNVPLRITSILYLDGNGLGNEDVLAASDIQGQLNIQFGTSDEMNSIKNETLYNSIIEASASVSRSSFNYDNDTNLTTKVTVNINGVEPKSVKAFFIREINASQGVREKTFELTKTADGSWTYDYTFDYPGTYIMRSVQIDGTEYDLSGTSYPRVVVEGFAISDVMYNLGEIIMTDKNTYSGEVMLRFVTNDVSKMPGKVQGNFVREDGTSATINFAYNPTNQMWVGTANFGSSGVYTMNTVTLDGRITPLGEGNSYTIDLTLGMRVNVTTSTYPTTFGTEDEDAPKKLVMQVQVLDNTGKPVVGLSNARLNYVNAGGSASTLETKLTWNYETECYEGELQVKEGIWKFNYVTVAMGSGTGLTTSTLTAAVNTTPVFTIVPPDPPSMSATQPVVDMYQYVKGADGVNTGAKVSVSLDDASAATVVGKITKANGEVKYVLGTLASDLDAGEEDVKTVEFRFILPEGEWTLSDVYAWNVYGAKAAGASSAPFYGLPLKDGTSDPITTEELVALLNDTATRDSTLATAYHVGATDATVAALYDVTAVLVYDDKALTEVKNTASKVYRFGKDKDGNTTAVFMDKYDIPADAIKLKVTDNEGLLGKYFDVTSAEIEYKYGAASYGGYTSETLTALQGTVFKKINFNIVGNTNIYSMKEGFTLQFATDYKPGALNVTVTERAGLDANEDTPDTGTLSVTDNNGSYAFEVYSVTPTATISAITPTGSNPTKITYKTSWGTPTFTAGTPLESSIDTDKNSATVYAVATADNSGLRRNGSFKQPTLTVTISGITADSVVTLVLPKGDSVSDITFSRTGNGTITKTLGIVTQLNTFSYHRLYAYYGHGTQTITTMTVVRDGVTYTVTLPQPITINNPSSVNQ